MKCVREHVNRSLLFYTLIDNGETFDTDAENIIFNRLIYDVGPKGTAKTGAKNEIQTGAPGAVEKTELKECLIAEHNRGASCGGRYYFRVSFFYGLCIY